MSVFPDRHAAHRYMAPPESCLCCNGRGYTYQVVPGTENDFIPDAVEVYCECPAGDERRRIES